MIIGLLKLFFLYCLYRFIKFYFKTRQVTSNRRKSDNIDRPKEQHESDIIEAEYRVIKD